MCRQSFLFFPPSAAHRALIEQDPEPRQTGIVDAKLLSNQFKKKNNLCSFGFPVGFGGRKFFWWDLGDVFLLFLGMTITFDTLCDRRFTIEPHI